MRASNNYNARFLPASKYGLELNIKKIHIERREIDFLGYPLQNGKLHTSSLKTKAVLNFPDPINVKGVQSCLDLISYFQKLVQDYSLIAKPLQIQIKITKCHFDEQQLNAFNHPKLLSANPVLCIYNPNNEAERHCDACIAGNGAFLLQKSTFDNYFHNVYFMRNKTTDTERK